MSGKSYIEYLLIVLVCLPLLFLNVKDSHDWGGDFSQYIQQAINISERQNVAQTGYIFNEDFAMVGPAYYPVGFPILLSPVYIISGNNIKAFTRYISFLLILLLLLVYVFLRCHFNFLTSFFAVLILAYNPWLLFFKTEVLADIPFTLFFLATIVLFSTKWKNEYLRYMTIGLLIGSAMLIKNIGFLLLGALFIDCSVKIIKSYKKVKKFDFSWLYLFVATTGSCLALYFLVSKLIFPGPIGHYSYFWDVYNSSSIIGQWLNASDYYILEFQSFFQPDAGRWSFAPLILKAFALSFFFVGLIKSIVKKPGFLEYTLLLYLSALLSFRNLMQGFRYLLPVFPLLMYYIIYGLSSIKLEIRLKKSLVTTVIGMAILLLYFPNLEKIVKNRKYMIAGPQIPESMELFDFVKKNLSPEAVVIFSKPRVLALYGGVNSYAIDNHKGVEEAERNIEKLGFDYILTCIQLSNQALDRYIEKHSPELEVIFKNKMFVLYQNCGP